jgi:hypothetical protein
LIFNFRKIIEAVRDQKNVKISILSQALECESIEGLTRTHLINELATEQFKLSTGIRLEKEFREAIIKCHGSSNGELDFFHFKRALPLIRFENAKLLVKINGGDIFGYWVNLIFGCFMAFFGLIIIFVLPSQIVNISFTQFIFIFALGVIVFSIGLFMVSLISPVNSAKRVKKFLESKSNR